nr:hypothetical protein [Poseidonocella sp. HB161398]
MTSTTRGGGVEPAHQFEPLAIAQRDIQQHQIGRIPPTKLRGRCHAFRRARNLDIVMVGQEARHAAQDGRLVIDQDHP